MRLTKHQAAGNDFLVLLDPGGWRPVGPDVVRAACHRHRGVGGDGLIRVTGGRRDADLTMHLFNADGSRAETSGNGIAALAQAAVTAGLAPGPVITVATDAGRRELRVDPVAAGVHRVSTDMGAVKVGEDEPEWLSDEIVRAVRVDVGNPHLVLHAADPDWTTDLVALGQAINESVPGGVNVEVVTLGPADGELTMRVYERGVGLTEACGTGACAAAAAARTWDLIDTVTTVHMPGGDAVVTVGDTVRYEVAVHSIAAVEFPYP